MPRITYIDINRKASAPATKRIKSTWSKDRARWPFTFLTISVASGGCFEADQESHHELHVFSGLYCRHDTSFRWKVDRWMSNTVRSTYYLACPSSQPGQPQKITETSLVQRVTKHNQSDSTSMANPEYANPPERDLVAFLQFKLALINLYGDGKKVTFVNSPWSTGRGCNGGRGHSTLTSIQTRRVR